MTVCRTVQKLKYSNFILQSEVLFSLNFAVYCKQTFFLKFLSSVFIPKRPDMCIFIFRQDKFRFPPECMAIVKKLKGKKTYHFLQSTPIFVFLCLLLCFPLKQLHSYKHSLHRKWSPYVVILSLCWSRIMCICHSSPLLCQWMLFIISFIRNGIRNVFYLFKDFFSHQWCF